VEGQTGPRGPQGIAGSPSGGDLTWREQALLLAYGAVGNFLLAGVFFGLRRVGAFSALLTCLGASWGSIQEALIRTWEALINAWRGCLAGLQGRPAFNDVNENNDAADNADNGEDQRR